VPAANLVPAWTADSHFCMIRYAAGVTGARGLLYAPNGDLFVAGNAQIRILFDTNGNGVSDAGERSTFASLQGGNHGLALTATHLYASSPTTVVRWTYTTGQRTATGTPETIVRGIGTGGHITRTLAVDSMNRLYVSIGSRANVDSATGTTPPSVRAVIRRYALSTIPAGGYDVGDGELFASGLRNEVGMTFDGQGRLWGVENGRDNLLGDAHYDNPAEEVNLFDTGTAGRNYGYPFCWSEGTWTNPMARGAGTQHLDMDMPGGFTEAMCQNANLVAPPAFAMRAHLAPLDIVEYTGTAYPAEFRGSLFVTSHGSWNRESTQVGRLIIRLRTTNGMPTAAENFLGELAGDGLREGRWAVRPVSIRVDPAGLLTFSDDGTGTINKIGYRP
jgi:glucose/arabinose dehydrogenase